MQAIYAEACFAPTEARLRVSLCLPFVILPVYLFFSTYIKLRYDDDWHFPSHNRRSNVSSSNISMTQKQRKTSKRISEAKHKEKKLEE